MKSCKDCVVEGVTTGRPAPHPGPRCVTHHRKVVKERKLRAHARHVQAEFGLDGDGYWRLYDAQGGRCAICRRARGLERHLAVDHNHDTGEIRGLLCQVCNYSLLGQFDREALQRALDYLDDPPARAVLTK